MIKLYPTTLTVALTAIALPAFSANGHYVPGVEGIGGAAVPPPGIYYRGYFVHYDIENLRDGGGSRGSATILTKSSRKCTNLLDLNYFCIVAHG